MKKEKVKNKKEKFRTRLFKSSALADTFILIFFFLISSFSALAEFWSEWRYGIYLKPHKIKVSANQIMVFIQNDFVLLSIRSFLGINDFLYHYK
jgi:hypothetical protein